MNWVRFALGLIVAAGLAYLWDTIKSPSQDTGYEAHGIEFVIPNDYHTTDLGEVTIQAAASHVLDAMNTHDKIAAVFTSSGNQIQFLVDVSQDLVDERVITKAGTVKRVFWRTSARERLRYATEHGDLALPGAPPPETRNPYH